MRNRKPIYLPVLVLLSTSLLSFFRSVATQNCGEDASDCAAFKEQGMCARNPYFMAERCPNCCGFCKGDESACRDQWKSNGDCHRWYLAGRCQQSPDEMRRLCRKTCGFCEEELDECPEDWYQAGSDCYNFVTLGLQWEAAVKYCRKKGGALASVLSRAESLELIQALQSLRFNSSFWIGLNDRKKEGFFQFADGSPLRFPMWGKKPPKKNRLLNCAAYTKTNGVFGVSVLTCSLRLPFICKVRPKRKCPKKCHPEARCVRDKVKGKHVCKCRTGFYGNGVTSCRKPCVCKFTKKTHFLTYDGAWIHFNGLCKYLLTKPVDDSASCQFEIRTKQIQMANSNRTNQFIELVWINTVIVIGREGFVTINKERKYMPLDNLPNDGILTLVGGNTVFHSSKCGYKITYNGLGAGSLEIDQSLWANKVTGICGNCNQNQADDYTTLNGRDVSQLVDKFKLIGKSYRVLDENEIKPVRGCDGDLLSSCSVEDKKKAEGPLVCGQVVQPLSPFKACLDSGLVKYNDFKKFCVYELCGVVNKPALMIKVLCSRLEILALECGGFGFKVDWKKAFKCGKKCPVDKVANVDRVCQHSCQSMQTKGQPRCLVNSRPDCVCRANQVLSGDKCVDRRRCGCLDERNQYHPLNSQWKNDECTRHFTCKLGQKIVAKPIRCAINARCTVKQGVRDCYCKLGYCGIGTRQCKDIYECSSKPCHPQADCVNTPGSYKCRCKPGFQGDGRKCCEDINECILTPKICSRDNARCVNTYGSYKCKCADGSSPKYSACPAKPKCNMLPCPENSKCLIVNKKPVCRCNTGFVRKEKKCIDINECKLSPKKCPKHAKCINTIGSYVCKCQKTFKLVGKVCQPINPCILNPRICGPNGACIALPQSLYTCKCKRGYEFDRKQKFCRDINECTKPTLNRCSRFADCKNTPGSYDCICRRSYFGDGRDCRPVSPCQVKPSVCSIRTVCKVVDSKVKCVCKKGYRRISPKDCADINECREKTHNCSHNAVCHNKPGGFICRCKPGFNGNGKVCNDVDECAKKTFRCHPNAECKNSLGSYSCQCRPGYRGDGRFCRDINECRESLDICPVSAHCTNTIGSYKCVCQTGFKKLGTTCVDINECRKMADNNCDHPTRAYCLNTIGSFLCRCKKGYTGNGFICRKKTCLTKGDCQCLTGFEIVNKKCVDINECVRGEHRCHPKANCLNTIGSYSCKCRIGYQGNGYACKPISYCSDNKHKCSKNAFCVSTPGSYKCVCNQYYYGNGFVCIEKDLCKKYRHLCDSNANCVNKKSTYKCICKKGYSGDGYRCIPIDNCKEGTSKCSPNANCLTIRGGRTKCVCKRGFEGDGIQCEDINECRRGTHRCSRFAICINTIGSYRCKCILKYQGDGKVCKIKTKCDDSEREKCHKYARCIRVNNMSICKCVTGFEGDGRTCIAINNCRKGVNKCSPNADCINKLGYYKCICKKNYKGDGFKCVPIDIDSCLNDSHKCDKNAKCIQLSEGQYTCRCKVGYEGNGYRCRDIDECRRGVHDCHKRAANCINTQGSYKCACKQGFTGNGVKCKDINECVEKKHKCCNDVGCINLFGSYKCICGPGYKGNGFLCADINECNDGSHECHPSAGICLNTVGSYNCFCRVGYKGNGRKCVKLTNEEYKLLYDEI